MSKPKNPQRSLLINALLLVIAFGLLGLVIYKNRGPIRDVFSRDLDPKLIALAFGIYLASLFLTFVRWNWLVRVIEPSFRLRDALLLGYVGNVYNIVIPGAVGGDLIKAAFLAKMKINTTKGIASMVLDRILGLLGLFILAGVAGIFAWSFAPPVVQRLILIVWAFLAAGFLGLASIFTQALFRLFPPPAPGVDGQPHPHSKLAFLLNELRMISETYRGRLGVVFGSFLLSAVCHGLNVLAFYTISRTMFPVGLPSIADHFLMVPLTLFTTAVPLPFGAIGLTEGVSDQLFKLVSHPSGALAMMGFRVLMYAGALVSLCVYLSNLGLVRSLTETAEHLEEELIED
ncbi:lysylphosphatidylglycerol synthase transmembrane domain-containing protein [Singulisphaera sp. PoT]|uniref:lysylphosphatidylglycerol synthase transmembrane domain-containing protein n=1 Tax=Singulisphaera sp. PoT TaxID=3411797 RepID=UPI003BF58D80